MKTPRSTKILSASIALSIAMLFSALPLRADPPAPAGDDSSANWYVFAPKSDVGPSVVGMEDWMDAPAHKHGFILVKGKDLVFEDGTPVKVWGVVSLRFNASSF